jgi:hypothetical protein
LDVSFSLRLIQVSVNGFVTFGQPLMNPQPKLIPTVNNVPMLAPFWADIDLTAGPGKVYYREYNRVTDDDSIDPLIGTDQLVFAMAERHVQTAMGDTGFYPTSVIVITWQAVSPYPSTETYTSEVWTFH